MSKTPASQLLASKRYYTENKDKINSKRKEYFFEYNKMKREEIINDEQNRLARSEDQINYQNDLKLLYQMEKHMILGMKVQMVSLD